MKVWEYISKNFKDEKGMTKEEMIKSGLNPCDYGLLADNYKEFSKIMNCSADCKTCLIKYLDIEIG